jgi:uncharacterized DUF497 family protein
MPDLSFDPAKSARNAKSRGLSFELVAEFEWHSALIAEDLRRDYGERRFQALGWIKSRLCALVFTPRDGRVHVISLRKANRREAKRYAATLQINIASRTHREP